MSSLLFKSNLKLNEIREIIFKLNILNNNNINFTINRNIITT